MKSFLLTAVLLSGVAHAWLPQDRDLAAFNATRFNTRSQHPEWSSDFIKNRRGAEKRFKPSLPNGVTKIRGVNFGGMFMSPRPRLVKARNSLQC